MGRATLYRLAFAHENRASAIRLLRAFCPVTLSAMTFALALLTAVVLVALAGLLLRNRLLDWITSRRGYSLRRDIPYGALPRQAFDLYTPDEVADDAPLVVFFYGGGWRSGSKDIYRFVAQPLASRGIIVAVPDYRIWPEVIFPGFVEDGARAVAELRRTITRADGSPRRMILMGHSAGAHIAALLVTDRRYLRAADVPADAIAGFVGLAGPYDFRITAEKYKKVFPPETRAAECQPIHFVDGKEPPMLLLAGAADRTLDPGNTTRMAARIRAKGGDVTAKLYPGVGHIGIILGLTRWLPLFNRPPVRADVLAFIRGR